MTDKYFWKINIQSHLLDWNTDHAGVLCPWCRELTHVCEGTHMHVGVKAMYLHHFHTVFVPSKGESAF